MNQITDGMWETPNEVWMPGGGVCFEGRMTTMRLADGSLLLHSPVPIDDALAETITAQGEVSHIVAPNLVHHLFAAAAKERFPHATLWAAPGLAEKVGLSPDAVLGEEFPDDAIETLPVPTRPHLNETVLLHHPSRSMVVTDLVFNIQEPKGWAMPLLLWMIGCSGELAVSRSMKFHFAKDDWDALGPASRALCELDWDRLVMGHGQSVEAGGRDALRGGVAWLPES